MSLLSADGALTDAARDDASGGSHAPAAHGSQWGLHGHADGPRHAWKLAWRTAPVALAGRFNAYGGHAGQLQHWHGDQHECGAPTPLSRQRIPHAWQR